MGFLYPSRDFVCVTDKIKYFDSIAILFCCYFLGEVSGFGFFQVPGILMWECQKAGVLGGSMLDFRSGRFRGDGGILSWGQFFLE